MLEFCMSHSPPVFGAVDDTAFGAKQKVGYQYSTMPRIIHETEKVRDRKILNIIVWWVLEILEMILKPLKVNLFI